MPTFRVMQAHRFLDVTAVTAMEARAKAALSGRFVATEPLDVYPASSAPPVPAAVVAEAERVQLQAGASAALGPERRFRRARVPGLLAAFAGLVVVLLAVLFGGGWAIATSVTRVGVLGDCAHIGLCTQTPLSTVTQRTGVAFPEGTERLRSTASRDGGWVSALVRLPAGAPVPTVPDSAASDVTPRAAAALESAGAKNLHGVTAGPVGVFSGTADDRTMLFVRLDNPAG